MKKVILLADRLAALIGSWPFLGVQSLCFGVWVVWNVVGWEAFDPYPFVFLNLVLSFQAAYTGPILLMAANRQSEIDRKRAEKNLAIDMADHRVIKGLEKHLDHHFHTLLQKLEKRNGKGCSSEGDGQCEGCPYTQDRPRENRRAEDGQENT